jgi:hypothetical protein
MEIGAYREDAAASRSYRNATLDSPLSPCTIGLVETLADRVRWILEHRTNPATGEPWREAQALGEAAGLKSPAHVGMMLRGTISNPRPQTLEPVAVDRLAAALMQAAGNENGP